MRRKSTGQSVHRNRRTTVKSRVFFEAREKKKREREKIFTLLSLYSFCRAFSLSFLFSLYFLFDGSSSTLFPAFLTPLGWRENGRVSLLQTSKFHTSKLIYIRGSLTGRGLSPHFLGSFGAGLEWWRCQPAREGKVEKKRERRSPSFSGLFLLNQDSSSFVF